MPAREGRVSRGRGEAATSIEIVELSLTGGPRGQEQLSWVRRSKRRGALLHRLLRISFMLVEKGMPAAISGGAVCCLESFRKCTVVYTYHNVPYRTIA